ncbi:Histone H2A [Armadillidium vulgare]|nr:Histone H2A [Armadillidium vulgare]
MEYMAAEVLELAGNTVKITLIIPRHLHLVIRNDKEFNKLVLPLLKEAFFLISRQFSFERRPKGCKLNYLIYKRRQKGVLERGR